ncbi:MAG TPA: ankyrin repeat domain-containing protein, partial [Phaeodactylibacter sp.]|nr:ankyrin repeat domain-containing protein [Phaeodactylibacter sp.]
AARMKEKHKAKIFQSIQDKYKVAEVGYLNALLMAIDKKDGEATRAFIDKIENLNQTEDSGISPLLAAVAKKHTKLASYLVDKGADPFLFIEKHNHSPFSKAVAEELSPFIEYLFPRFKEKIAAYCNDEQLSLSPQFLAYKNPKIFDLLLGAGAKPHWGGREGKAPLVKAVEKASLAMLPVLVKNKIDLNQTVEGKTLLEWAILFNRPEWVSGLLDEMVDLTIPTSEGGTFIDLAQKLEGREDILQLLMEEE